MNFKLTVLILLLLSMISAFAKKADEIVSLEKACNFGNGLSCAKMAYHHKKTNPSLAYEFYQKGCELKDESACFNVRSINPKQIYYLKADGVMKFNSQNISNCHIPVIKNKYSNIQLKEVTYLANFIIQINSEGLAESTKVETTLSKNFVECAKKIIKTIKFPKPETGMQPFYDYSLVIQSYE